MTREEIYDRLILLAERAIEWRAASEDVGEIVGEIVGESSVYPAKSICIFTSHRNGGVYRSVSFGTLVTVGRYDGDAYHIRKIEAPYSEEQLRKVESELPEYERLIAEAIASTATASIT